MIDADISSLSPGWPLITDSKRRTKRSTLSGHPDSKFRALPLYKKVWRVFKVFAIVLGASAAAVTLTPSAEPPDHYIECPVASTEAKPTIVRVHLDGHLNYVESGVAWRINFTTYVN